MLKGDLKDTWSLFCCCAAGIVNTATPEDAFGIGLLEVGASNLFVTNIYPPSFSISSDRVANRIEAVADHTIDILHASSRNGLD